MEFINSKEEMLTISADAKSIMYKKQEFFTTTVFYFTQTDIKILTEEFIIKFSKGELNIYDTENTLLDTFVFNKILNNKSRVKEKGKITMSFTLKQNYILELLNDNTINNNGNIENIIETYKVGNQWIVYKTNLNNNLTVSSNTNYHHKFNGIPVSKNI